MENRRTLTLFLLFVVTWMWLAPKLFPNLFPALQNKPKPVAPAQVDPSKSGDAGVQAAKPADDAVKPAEIASYPHREVVLGPQDDKSTTKSETYLRVVLTTRGAAVESAELLDPRFTTLDRKSPLKIVGNHFGPKGGGETRESLETSVPEIDAQLSSHKQTLATTDWEVVPGSESATSVTFRYRAPDGSIEVRKKYEIQKASFDEADYKAQGYMLGVELTVENLTDQLLKTRYSMLGPAGLPLEDPDNARTFIELKAGVYEDTTRPDRVSAVSPLLAGSVIKEFDKATANNDLTGLTVWNKPIRYAGADVQFFAALLLPRDNQAADGDTDGRPDNYFSEIRPVILYRDTAHTERSDVSLEFTSTQLELPAKSATTHKFDLFLGPKRAPIMDALDARPVMNYGWWHPVSATLLGMLNFFHHWLHLPYFACIVLLTCCVRGVMFPISFRQTAGAAKMKEIQPELAELRKKYSKEPEKFALAQRELFRKHNYNPFAGCLPVFLQLPIFIGLYNALYYAIDLRLAKFLWVDNLAAPDALFRFPGPIPLLGWTELNLLPLITVSLFLAQQKMFLPAAETDEQRMTNKMMSIMTVFMGYMFYRSPSGLCIYFIASSLWGMSERKLLERMKPRLEKKAAEKQKLREDKPRGKTWLDKLVEAADQARQQTGNGKASGTKGSTPSDRARR